MSSIKRQARIAGLLYLVVAVVATVGLLVIPRGLIVPGDAAATASRIVASETLFRLRIVSELVSTTFMLFLVLVLYRLFKDVNEAQARLMVALVAVGVPIAYLLVLNDIAALIVFRSPDFLQVFEKQQLDALGYLFLRIHTQGGPLATIFWGLWLFPFGVLVIQSGLIPRVFGWLLIVNSAAYVLDASTKLLVPQYGSIVSRIVIVPELVGELAIIAWLLIRGAREEVVPLTAGA